MLRILGSPRSLCRGITRRELLCAGGLGLAGLSLADLLAGQAVASEQQAPRPASFGRAKNVILLHLYGSPSQLEWADMKPHAPVEIRGELKGIPSTLPGCNVCELLPNLAKVMDRTTVIRSMTHEYPIHGVAFALTGVPTIDVAMELAPNDPRHWPFVGSVVDYLEELRSTRPPPVPRNIALPFPFSSQRVGEVPRAGPYAAFLGRQFDPVWTNFVGQGTRGIRKVLGTQVFTDPDPYIALAEGSYFTVPAATQLQPDVTLDRLRRRRSLVAQFDDARRRADATADDARLDRYQSMAFDVLQSDRLRSALDLRLEPAATRELYGPTLFGQSCLAARRLIEAGTRIASVFWDEYGLAGHAWDTHYDHFPRMKQELCPGLDRAWHGLITDLDQRGLLDETLVICTSEHGRTPQINSAGGRDHWSRAYTTMLAGGGIARGRVIGATDNHGGEVVDAPASPKDLLATMYHLLGFDPRQELRDKQGRPMPLVEGAVLAKALA